MIGWSVVCGNRLEIKLHKNFWQIHFRNRRDFTLDALKTDDMYRY